MLRKTGFVLALITACAVAAAVTVSILNFAAGAAKAQISAQEPIPDYVRYISQGYGFDTVSTKKSYLLTVTDGDLPVRIHIFTVDETKHTVDILELPPDVLLAADGFVGTAAEAYPTGAYRGIVSASLYLKIDGEASMSAETFGDCALLIKACGSEKAKNIAIKGDSYSLGDKNAVGEYRELLAEMLSGFCGLGRLKSFTLLMNLIANRVDTSMTVSEITSAFSSCKGVTPEKINIHISPGFAAKYDGRRVWALDRKGVAELLNESFRVKGKSADAGALGIPELNCEEFPYGDLPVKVSDITD